MLWDWESTRLGHPLEDFFHWRAQRLLRFGQGSVGELVALAAKPDDVLLGLCERLEVDPASAPDALQSCLELVTRRDAAARRATAEAAVAVELATDGAPA